MKKPYAMLMILGKIMLTAMVILGLVFLGMTALILVGFVLFRGMDANQFLPLPSMTRSMLFLSSSVNIVAVIMMYFMFERKQRWSLGWQQQHRLKAGLEGAGWGIFMITVTFFIIWLFGGIQITGFTLDQSVFEGLFFAIIVFALVAVGEELLCRGYWYGLIRKDFGPIAAIIVTSVVFASLHLFNENILQNTVPLINLILAGVLFGVSREVTGGLWVPIGIHFTWNLFQGNIYGFAVSGLPMESSIIRIEAVGSELISGGGFGAEGSMITTVILLIFTFFIARWYQKHKAH